MCDGVTRPREQARWIPAGGADTESPGGIERIKIKCRHKCLYLRWAITRRVKSEHERVGADTSHGVDVAYIDAVFRGSH